MSPNEKLTELLTGKWFQHNGDDYAFVSCKSVGSNLMIITNKKTLQIPVDRFVDFYQKVEKNCYEKDLQGDKKQFVPAELPLKKEEIPVNFKPAELPLKAVIVPEKSVVFDKLNNSFENLIDAIDNVTDDNLKFLESKAKMLTSVAQTAINMENSRVNLIKMFNK